jgi:hypothetical protein
MPEPAPKGRHVKARHGSGMNRVRFSGRHDSTACEQPHKYLDYRCLDHPGRTALQRRDTATPQTLVISTEVRSVSDGEWRNLLFRQRHHQEGHDFSSRVRADFGWRSGSSAAIRVRHDPNPSREAAKDCSPPRKRWVNKREEKLAPKGRKNL